MPSFNASLWRGLFDAPESEPAQRISHLIARRVELRAASREAELNEAAASRALDRASNEFREAKAEYTAFGGPKEELTAAEKAFTKAQRELERAKTRRQDAQDAVDLVENAAATLLHDSFDELMSELSANAEVSAQAAERGLALAQASLDAWVAQAQRQEVLITSSGSGPHRAMKTPFSELREMSLELQKVRGRLPDPNVGAPAQAVGTVTEGDEDLQKLWVTSAWVAD